MNYTGGTNEYFEVSDVDSSNCHVLKTVEKSVLSLLWFEEDGNKLRIDAKVHTFDSNDILFLTEFHKVETIGVKKLKLLRFNKPFYCILDHDSEIGCKGILYFGASKLPIVKPAITDVKTLKVVWEMLLVEMASKDNLQLEMLQMMLKRILILCTRIYKQQENYDKLDESSSDQVREFNFLVEKYFKERHSVADYAEMLHKSPKTLSNVFKKMEAKSPLQFINDRLMLEARRLLRYADMSISEVGYEIGFADVQAFSRFFKKNESLSPRDYKNLEVSGRIANSSGKAA